MGTVWNSWQTTWSGTVVRDDGVPAAAIGQFYDNEGGNEGDDGADM